MPDKYDTYREALIVESETVWPEDYDDWDLDRRSDVETKLHETPEEAGHLEYVRTHTGFCRRITVTAEDVERLA